MLSLRLSWADVTKWILASLAVNYFLNMLHGHTVISITASLGIVFEFLHARTLDVTLEDTNQAGCVSLRQSAASYNTLIVSSVFIHNGSCICTGRPQALEIVGGNPLAVHHYK